MKEQQTPLPTGPVELDLFDNVTEDSATPPEAEAAPETETATEAEAEDPETPETQESTESTEAEGQTPAEPVKKKKKKKKKRNDKAEKPKTFFDQVRDFIDEDEEQPININVHGLLGGDGLPGLFRRNWLFITIIVFFTCCYVTCRYMMQSAVIEHDKLSEQLVDRRYKNLTLDCKLLENTLSSKVEKSLKDSTIHAPTEQMFRMKAPKE